MTRRNRYTTPRIRYTRPSRPLDYRKLGQLVLASLNTLSVLLACSGIGAP